VVPDCCNPFGPPMSNKVLIEFATRRDVLLRHIELKGNVDGEEIITLKNITREVEVITNHPAVSSMKRTDIKNYIQKSGILKQIEKNLIEAQTKYLAELKRRKVNIPSATQAG